MPYDMPLSGVRVLDNELFGDFGVGEGLSFIEGVLVAEGEVAAGGVLLEDAHAKDEHGEVGEKDQGVPAVTTHVPAVSLPDFLKTVEMFDWRLLNKILLKNPKE